MKTNQHDQAPAVVFLQMVSVALAQLKQRLQQDYEQAYPDLGQIIRIVLNDEEARAWELTLFPHLLLPDMVEARLASLNMRRDRTRYHARERHEFLTYQPLLATWLGGKDPLHNKHNNTTRPGQLCNAQGSSWHSTMPS